MDPVQKEARLGQENEDIHLQGLHELQEGAGRSRLARKPRRELPGVPPQVHDQEGQHFQAESEPGQLPHRRLQQQK